MSEPNATPKRALRPKEFQQAFGICHVTFYAMVKRGELAIRKRGRSTLIMAEEVERWQSSLPVGPMKPAAGKEPPVAHGTKLVRERTYVVTP
jgi:predicted DNA-binding transcriptional regulator AlpA